MDMKDIVTIFIPLLLLTMFSALAIWVSCQWFLSLSNNKILVVTKLIAFADNKINVTHMMIFVFDRVENIVGKGKKCWRLIFSFSHNVFKRLFFLGSLKSQKCVGNVNKGTREMHG